MKNGYAFPALHYLLEITRRCNLRCEMCLFRSGLGQSSSVEQSTQELTTAEWIDVVDQTGPQSLVTFSGGEPWVRDDFLPLLEHASRKRRTHYLTNATRLTDACARRSVELAPSTLPGNGLCFVGISLHGTQPIHDQIVDEAGAFEKAFEGVRALAHHRREQNKRFPYIHVTTVIKNENLAVLCELPALVAEAGADILNLAREVRPVDVGQLPASVSPDADAGDFALPDISPARLQDALDATLRAARRARIEVRLPDMPRHALLGYYGDGLDLNHFACHGAWTTLMIRADGAACPCYVFEVGNVREQPLKDIWNGTAMRECRRQLQTRLFPPCQGCCYLHHRTRMARGMAQALARAQ